MEVEAEAVSVAAVVTAVIVRRGQALESTFVKRLTCAIYNAKTTILLIMVFEKRRKTRKDVLFVWEPRNVIAIRNTACWNE